jgi:hypothetical protein
MQVHTRRLRGVCLAVALAVLIVPASSMAEERMETEAGFGALAAVSTLLYGPLKIVYATGGLVVGSFAWALSGGDAEVMRAVITPSVRGDYVVTPDHLRGDRTLEFFGREPYRRAEAIVAEESL